MHARRGNQRRDASEQLIGREQKQERPGARSLHPVDEPPVLPLREPLESERRPEHVASQPLSAFPIVLVDPHPGVEVYVGAQVALHEGGQAAPVAAPFAGLREKRLQVIPEHGVKERLLRLPPAIAQRRAGGAVMAFPGRRDRLAGRRHPVRLRKRVLAVLHALERALARAGRQVEPGAALAAAAGVYARE